jgi:uncharacterized membrane protein
MFAVAFIAFGLLQFFYGDFVPGRPPAWPQQLLGGLIWAYATGAVFVIAGAAILIDRYTPQAGLAIAALVFAWAVTRNLPLALADPNFGGAWTRLGKAVALTGGAVAVAGAASRSTTASIVGRVAFGAFLIASGVQHFLFPDAVATLVPAWIPGPRLWGSVAGVALIAGGTGLIVPRTTQLAGLCVGLMLFTWFCILHIPRALAAAPANQRNEWTAVVEAFAFAAIAFLATARPTSIRRAPR